MFDPIHRGKLWSRRLAGAFALLLLIGLGREGGAADALPAPKGPTILVVSGKVTRPNQGDAAAFDRAMLDGLARHTIRTETVWTKGVKTFEGVLARDVFAAAGATGSEVRAIARNDYAVTIPMSDFTHFDVILALRMDGVDLKPREKGPVWIVYPRDQHRELKDAAYDSRWVWQLRQLEVK